MVEANGVYFLLAMQNVHYIMLAITSQIYADALSDRQHKVNLRISRIEA